MRSAPRSCSGTWRCPGPVAGRPAPAGPWRRREAAAARPTADASARPAYVPREGRVKRARARRWARPVLVRGVLARAVFPRRRTPACGGSGADAVDVRPDLVDIGPDAVDAGPDSV